MAVSSGRPLYVKGTAKITFFNTSTDDVIYSSNKLQTSQIQTSVNLGAIQGGLGNATLINLPDTPNFTLNMTAADFSLDAQGMQVGSTPHYNAPILVRESATLTGGKLTVSGTPVAPVGTSTGNIVGTVNGVAYLFSGKELTITGGTEGANYCVEYWVNKLQSRQLDILTMFAPMIVRALIEAPVFSSETGDLTTGSRVGTLYITVPRLQLNGDLNIDMSQTTASTTVLNGTALSFDEYQTTTGNACAQNEPKLAYMSVDLSDEDTYDNVTALAVIGGGVSGAAGDVVASPLVLVMNNGETQPISNYADFTFAAESTVATVDSTTGAITIGSAGGDIKVAAASTIGRSDLTANIQVDVAE